MDEKLNRCYKIHLDLTSLEDLNGVLERLSKISNFTIIDNNIVVWLDDGAEKKDLLKRLKSAGVKEFFCEQIEYKDIGKEENYNYLSAWFLDNYRNYSLRRLEAEQQDTLNQMYNDIERAKALFSVERERNKALKTNNEVDGGGG